MRLRLPSKLALAASAGMLLALACAVPLLLGQFDRELRNIKGSHFRYVVDEVANATIVKMDLGFPLSSIRELEDIVERERIREPHLDSIVVFDMNGVVLFGSDPGEVGTTIPAAWMEQIRANRGEHWTVKTRQHLIAGAGLVNSFDLLSGGIILASSARHWAPLNEQAAIVFVGAAVALGLIWLVLLRILAAAALRPVSASIDATAVALGGLAHDDPQSPPADAPAPYSRFHTAAATALTRLRASGAEVERLDRTG